MYYLWTCVLGVITLRHIYHHKESSLIGSKAHRLWVWCDIKLQNKSQMYTKPNWKVKIVFAIMAFNKMTDAYCAAIKHYI